MKSGPIARLLIWIVIYYVAADASQSYQTSTYTAKRRIG
jgi:hypothetical protein